MFFKKSIITVQLDIEILKMHSNHFLLKKNKK